MGSRTSGSGGTCGDTIAQSQMASTWTLRESREVVERLLHTRPWGPKGASGSPDPAGAEASHGSLDNVEGTQDSHVASCVSQGTGDRAGDLRREWKAGRAWERQGRVVVGGDIGP